MPAALCRFSEGDVVKLRRSVSDNVRKLLPGEDVTIHVTPYDKTYCVRGSDGHTIWNVPEHDLLARDEAPPTGLDRIMRIIRSQLARLFPGSQY